MIKKMVSLFLCMLLILSVCGVSVFADEEPVTIRLAMRNIGSAISTDNDINRAIEAATGVKVEIDFKPGSDYATTCQMVLAGDLPDAMEWHCSVYPNDLQNLADDGLLMPLDDLLPEYAPNIVARRTDDSYFRSATDNKIYGIACRTQPAGSNDYIAIRKDWLEKLGLATPNNSEELYQVLTAFRDHAAELVGEGVDFWPMGASKGGNGIYQRVFDLFASENSIIREWNVVGEDLVYHINMPGYKETLQTIRKFYQDGLIDPEYALMSRDDMLEKMYKNTYGCWHFYLDNSDPNMDTWAKTFYSYYPEAYPLGSVANLQDKDGNRHMIAPHETQTFVIFNTCEHPDAVLKVMNYLVSDEGIDLVQIGIKDVDWIEDENGKVTMNELTPERKVELGYRSYYLYMMNGYLTPTRCYDPAVLAIGEENAAATAGHPSIVLNATPTYLDNGTTLKDIEETYSTRLIIDKDIDFDAVFNEFIEKWNAAGGAQWTTEYNEEYHQIQAMK